MAKKVRTVLGDIAPEALGYTSLHDHTFGSLATAAEYLRSIFMDVDDSKLCFRPENYNYLKQGNFLLVPELQDMGTLEELTSEYMFFKELGGDSVVDAMPATARRPGQMPDVAALSKATGLNLIVATGFYHDTAIPADLKGRPMSFYYDFMKKEVEEGIEDSGVRPGLLKGAFNTCGETEQNIVEACMRLSAETGMSTHIHTEPTVDGDELVEIVDRLAKKYALDPDRVHVCHMDNRLLAATMVTDFLEDPDTERSLDLDVQKKLLSRGYTIGLDTWGMPIHNINMFMPDDFDRLKALITLIDLGYGDQLTLGNDFSSKIEWRKYGGCGCTRFADFAGPLMEMMGREEQYHKLVYENPMRIMQF